MRIRPTALGCKGLLLLLALEVAFLATAYSNLFFLLLTFSTVLGAMAALWTVGNLRTVRVLGLDVPLAAAGTPRDVVCRLAASRPRWDLAVELVLADGSTALGRIARLAGDGSVHGMLPGRARGLCPVRAVRIVSRFPLGLFVARTDLPVTAEVVTHPATLAASGRRSGAGAADGDEDGAGRRGAATAALRPFRTGDAFGDVHWKATARRGEPIVKERERDGADGCDFVLDRRCTPAALEHALATVATAALAEHAGRVRLHSQDAALTAADRTGREALLRWLAAATTLPADAPSPPLLPGRPRRLPAATATPAEVLA